jgi:hypothetical protein
MSQCFSCMLAVYFSPWMLIIPLISFYQFANYIVSICSQIKNDLIVLPSMLVSYNCRWRWCLEVILCTSKTTYFFSLKVCKPPPPPLTTTNLWALELLTSSQLCTPSSFLADPQFKLHSLTNLGPTPFPCCNWKPQGQDFVYSCLQLHTFFNSWWCRSSFCLRDLQQQFRRLGYWCNAIFIRVRDCF